MSCRGLVYLFDVNTDNVIFYCVCFALLKLNLGEDIVKVVIDWSKLQSTSALQPALLFSALQQHILCLQVNIYGTHLTWQKWSTTESNLSCKIPVILILHCCVQQKRNVKVLNAWDSTMLHRFSHLQIFQISGGNSHCRWAGWINAASLISRLAL